jgi:hypothetical protein
MRRRTSIGSPVPCRSLSGRRPCPRREFWPA